MPDEVKAQPVKPDTRIKSWSVIARRIRVPLGFACAVLYFWLARPTVSSIAIGAIVLIPGVCTRALASGHVKKNEELATSGPYAYTRNPLYLGSLILALGFVLAAQSWWIAALLLAMFFAIYLPVIRSEEVYLRERFPEYAAYAENVPRLLPTLRGFDKSGVKFSWDLYRKHREYNALIGSAAMILLLLAKMHWVH